MASLARRLPKSSNPVLRWTSFCKMSSTSTTPEPLNCDILVVGGGLIGAALTCGIANNPVLRGLRVFMVEGKPLSEPRGNLSSSKPPDPRVVALSPLSIQFLKDAGIWGEIEKGPHSPFDTMQVWDHAGRGFVRYLAKDIGHSVLGYVVENDVLVAALHGKLQETFSDSVKCIAPASVSSIEWRGQEKWPFVQLSDGTQICSRLVVGADGGNSKVRELSGLKTKRKQYNQRAVVATVEHKTSHMTAWQRFLPSGPLALLPCGGLYSNIVWSTSESHARKLESMEDEDFVKEVNTNLLHDSHSPLSSSSSSSWLNNLPFISSLSLSSPSPSSSFPSSTSLSSTSTDFEFPPEVIASHGRRFSFPLTMAHANSYTGNRVALVGDSAHTVHPLAGQGANLGLADAKTMVEILAKGVKIGADVGDATVLEDYEKRRRGANLTMMAGLDSLQKIFSVQWEPFAFARNLGLQAVNSIGPVKRRVMAFAMGV